MTDLRRDVLRALLGASTAPDGPALRAAAGAPNKGPFYVELTALEVERLIISKPARVRSARGGTDARTYELTPRGLELAKGESK